MKNPKSVKPTLNNFSSFKTNENLETANYSQDQASFVIKIDIAFEKSELLFSTTGGQQISLLKIEESDPTFKTLHYRYFLTSGHENNFDLQSYLKLGLFEPEGWNLFTVLDNQLYINKSPTTIILDSPIV